VRKQPDGGDWGGWAIFAKWELGHRGTGLAAVSSQEGEDELADGADGSLPIKPQANPLFRGWVAVALSIAGGYGAVVVHGSSWMATKTAAGRFFGPVPPQRRRRIPSGGVRQRLRRGDTGCI